jgi:integrase
VDYLTKRDGVWQYQRRVPHDVRSLLGTRWRQSLKTQDRRAAAVAARDLAAINDGQIAAARARLARGPVELALADLEGTRREIADKRAVLNDRPQWRELALHRDAGLSQDREALEDTVSTMVDHANSQLDKQADAALVRANLVIAREAKKVLPGTARAIQDRVAAHGGIDSLIEQTQTDARDANFASSAVQFLEDCDEGETPAQTVAREDESALMSSRRDRAEKRKLVKESLLTALLPETATDYSPSGQPGVLTIQRLYQRWCREAAVAPDRQRKVAVYVRRFGELFGQLPVDKMTKTQVREFASVLAEIPDITHLPRAQRSSDLKALVQIGRDRPALPRLSKGTINRHLEALAAIFSWAETQELVSFNPAHGIKAPAFAVPEKDIRPFKPAEIRSLLKVVDAEWGKPDRKNRDRWWVVYIAVWSGARLAEICQLRKEDVRQERGVWLFDINNQHGKSLKNEASIRRIPIHPHLLKLGLLDHVNSSPDNRVFTSLPNKKPASHGHEISKSFGKLKQKKLGWIDPSLNFHSLRHSFEDGCKEAGIPKDVREALLGHSLGTYGDGFSLSALAQHLAKLDPVDCANTNEGAAA